MLNMNIMAFVNPKLKDLYSILEEEFHPLQLSAKVSKAGAEGKPPKGEFASLRVFPRVACCSCMHRRKASSPFWPSSGSLTSMSSPCSMFWSCASSSRYGEETGCAQPECGGAGK
jgi:hypothetical protein